MGIRIAGAILLALPIAGNAMCFAPTPPAPPFMAKPAEPFCMVKWRHTQKMECELRDREAYHRSLSDYQTAMTAYARQAADFAQQAVAYAACESDEVAKAKALAVERPSWLRHN